MAKTAAPALEPVTKTKRHLTVFLGLSIGVIVGLAAFMIYLATIKQ